jgi:NADP-dependent 3-hydroxy acid dehydrogenase YdfG
MGERFNGKVALIPRGTGSYGLAAESFAVEAGLVGSAELRSSDGANVAVHWCAAGHEMVSAPTDVSDASKAPIPGQDVKAALASLTVLMNPAGSFSAVPQLEATGVEWARAVNVNNLLLVTKAVLPVLIGGGGASIASTCAISTVAETATEFLHSNSKGAGYMFACAA